MPPVEFVGTRAPTRTLYVATSFDHASSVRPEPGDFLGVADTKDTFVRQNDAWVATSKQSVMDAFGARGLLMLADVPTPALPKDKSQ